MNLGLENKRLTALAAMLGVVAVVTLAYELIPLFTDSSAPTSSAQAAAPALSQLPPPRPGKAALKLRKQPQTQNLDPTLRLDLLAIAEKTQYEGHGKNIFVSQREDVSIPPLVARGNTDSPQEQQHIYTPPPVQAAPPIPLRFYGFASSPGEPKRIFLKNGEDVFVAGEGEIVDRRYKVVHISATSVEIEDMVYSGPPQTIPLTQG